MIELSSHNEEHTIALGERVGSALMPGDLVALAGPLGAGKTVFVRGLASGAGTDPREVRSPTFVLHHVYRGSRLTLHHIDLYRLGPVAELQVLDIEGLLESGAVAIEWSDLADLRVFDPARITIEALDDGARLIRLEEPALPRLAAAWVHDR